MFEDEKQQIFENRLLVKLPDSFEALEPEKIEKMFPYQDRPQLIMGNGDVSRFCTFSLIRNQSLGSAQVKKAIKTMFQVITSLYPSSQLCEPEVQKLKHMTCGWFEFQTIGDAGNIHNFMYIVPVQGMMMLGTLGCLMGDEEGEKQMGEIMQSLELPEKRRGFSGGRL